MKIKLLIFFSIIAFSINAFSSLPAVPLNCFSNNKYCTKISIERDQNSSKIIKVKAIIKNRSILDDPNPMSHLITDTVNKLRDAINLNVNNYKQKHKEHLTQLKSDKHWLQLTDEQQESILTKRSLDKLPNVDLSDIDSVIESLEKASIGQWNDRTESLNAKFDSARMEAVQLLQPKIQQISLPKSIFETEDDVKAWLQKVESKILAKLSDGPVTF